MIVRLAAWLSAHVARRRLCRICYGEQITYHGVLVCVDCDQAVIWRQYLHRGAA
jgi:uncharacterized protein (UPF0248 family)